MVIKLRARRDEDKAERRGEIMAAGLELWNETTWSEFTMAAVAERAGIVKGTVYLYFATKEQLFLVLIEELMSEFFDHVDAKLEEGGRWTKSRVAQVLTDALRGRDAFTRMLTVLGSILEHNVEYEAALGFKRLMLQRFARTGALLEKRLPFLKEGLRFLMHCSAIVTGLAHMAYPAPVLERVFEVEELRVLRVDLQDEFHAAVSAILDGLERRNRR